MRPAGSSRLNGTSGAAGLFLLLLLLLGPLTEQGLPGVLLVVALFLTTFATGVRVFRTAKDPAVGHMALAFTLSLLTYYVHGVFNNFLDTDKFSVPFWAFTAAVVALDLYSEKKEAQ